MYRNEKGQFSAKPDQAAFKRANTAYAQRIAWSEPEVWTPETHNHISQTPKQPLTLEYILLALFFLFVALYH